MKYTIALIAVISVAQANHFKSGAVTGFEKFTYGKFVTRMQAPDKKGTVSSFFTYWNGPNFYPGGWNELDIEIVPSVEQNPFSMNVIYGDGHSKHETHDYHPSFDPKDEWHIYEMAWTPEFIAWSIDNQEVRRVTKDDPSIKFTDKPQSIMMNFWTPTFESWGKGLDAKDMPWYVKYDYVETYSYDTETKGFEFKWRDNFTTFDTNRWHKSDNTTFDANSTTFRASQSYIEDGNLVLKMEPDLIQNIHGAHKFEEALVESVRTMPTPDHTVQKQGEKPKKSDDHYDVAAEQHYSRIQREAHEYEQGYGDQYHHIPVEQHHGGEFYQPRHDQYQYGAEPHSLYNPEDPYHHSVPYQHEPVYHQYGDQYIPEHSMYEEAYAYNPYHHPETPKTKAEAEQHMGPEAALLYKEMHDQQKPQAQQQQQPQVQQPQQQSQQSTQQQKRSNFATRMHTEHEETPYEHTHPYEQHQMHELSHGFEHHPDAHFEQGYWDLKDHVPHLGDEGHFAGEEHGEYHYVEPERDEHLGHYYSYVDDREHHPQHVDQHHDTHGIEHRPDDWHNEHETHWAHHDEYHSLHDREYFGGHDEEYGHGSEHYMGQDFRHQDSHDYHPDLTHDVEKHHGQGMMSEIEHEYDQLYHNIEHHTRHGVEHHDQHYTKQHAVDYRDDHEVSDFHAVAPHYEIEHHFEPVHIEEIVHENVHHERSFEPTFEPYVHDSEVRHPQETTTTDDKKTKYVQKKDQEKKSGKKLSHEGDDHMVHDYLTQQYLQ